MVNLKHLKNKREAFQAGYDAGIEDGRAQGLTKARFEFGSALAEVRQSNAELFEERARRVENAANHRIENGVRDAAAARKVIETERDKLFVEADKLRATVTVIAQQLNAAVATIKALL